MERRSESPAGTAAFNTESVQSSARAWQILILLCAANTFNFFDRSIPGVLGEPIRHHFALSDFQLGLLSTSFTLVFALAGIPLAWIADKFSRKMVIVVGLAMWTLATGLTALAWNFESLAILRVAVGIGEASFGPAVVSTIADLFPAHRRSKAVGLYMLGLPIGLLLSYGTVGFIAQAFDSWRAAFVVAAVPGIFLVFGAWRMLNDPVRGAADEPDAPKGQERRSLGRVLKKPTVWFIILSGAAVNVGIYAVFSFIAPVLQRYYGLPLQTAGAYSSLMIGATGILGMGVGGWISDWMYRRHPEGRMLFGTACMSLAGLATWYALSRNSDQILLFGAAFGLGWLLQFQYYVVVYPVLQGIVEPHHRSRITAIYFACSYLLGGAYGPSIVGRVSDHFAHDAMTAAGALSMSERFKAIGLHDAMYLVPISLGLTALFLLLATIFAHRERRAASGTSRNYFCAQRPRPGSD